MAEEQEVQVERPLAPADLADPTRFLLDPLKHLEELVGVEGRIQVSRRVHERPLAGRTSDGFCFVKRTDSADDHAGGLSARGFR